MWTAYYVATLFLVDISFFSLHGRDNNKKKSDGNPTLSSPIKKSEVKDRERREKKRLNPVGFFFGSVPELNSCPRKRLRRSLFWETRKTSARSFGFGFYEDARILTDFLFLFFSSSLLWGCFNGFGWFVFYFILLLCISRIWVLTRERVLGGKVGAGSEEKRYWRLFNVRWLAGSRSRSLLAARYSLLCKTTRRKEVETFIGFHDSTSEYASERQHR